MAYAHRPAMDAKTVMVMHNLDDGNLAPTAPSVVDYLQSSGIHRVVCGHKPFGDSPGHIRTSPGFEVVCADTSFSDVCFKTGEYRGAAVSEVLIHGQREWNQVQVHGTLADGTNINYRLPPVGDASVAACAAGDCAGEVDGIPSLLAGDNLIGRPLKGGPSGHTANGVANDGVDDDDGAAADDGAADDDEDWDGWWVKTPVHGAGPRAPGMHCGAGLEYLVVKGEGFKIKVKRLSQEQVRHLVV